MYAGPGVNPDHVTVAFSPGASSPACTVTMLDGACAAAGGAGDRVRPDSEATPARQPTMRKANLRRRTDLLQYVGTSGTTDCGTGTRAAQPPRQDQRNSSPGVHLDYRRPRGVVRETALP